MKALIVGPGKMGRAVETVLLARGHAVTARIGRGDAIPSPGCDLAFEFTHPAQAARAVEALLRAGLPVVSGTTGWDVGPARRLATEREVPFLHAPNFSIGVAVLRRAAAAVSAGLTPFAEYEAGIVERHHAAKKDAPSGTARALADSMPGRVVPIVSLRHGGQPGEHSVLFEGEDESIELVHRARSRALFAAGAVKAAEWLLASGLRGPVTFDDFLEGRSAS